MGCQGPLDQALSGQPAGRVDQRPRRDRATAIVPWLAIILALVAGSELAADDVSDGKQVPSSGSPAAKTAPATPAPASQASPGAAAGEPIDRQPYRIELHLALDPSARIDADCRSLLLKEWQSLVRRLVGPPWIITIASQPSPLASGDLESLDNEAFAHFDPAYDKIWLIRISAGDSAAGLVFTGREYDSATRRLGPLQVRKVLVLADAPRALLRFALGLFNPTALITGQEGGRALLLVRGAAITPASDLGRVVTKGTVFFPLRLVTMKDNTLVIRRIIFTYLQVQETQGSLARCAIITPLRDPLTQREPRPNTLAALGIKPGGSPIHYRFVTRPDLAPAAGYTLTARTVPDGLPREVGMTDRAGRITLKPGFASGLVILRLLAAESEPMVEFPVMPGESGETRDIPIDPKPLTVSYQVKLDALRDEVIDLVAQRARLEKRLEARLQGEDYAGIEQGLKEYALLPSRKLYADRLASLKDEATKEQARTKAAVLTKNIQARFNDLQALIDRYLDDEAFATYTEAIEHKNEKQQEASQTKAKPRQAPRVEPAPTQPAVPTGPAPGGRDRAKPAAKPAPAKSGDVPF